MHKLNTSVGYAHMSIHQSVGFYYIPINGFNLNLLQGCTLKAT